MIFFMPDLKEKTFSFPPEGVVINMTVAMKKPRMQAAKQRQTSTSGRVREPRQTVVCTSQGFLLLHFYQIFVFSAEQFIKHKM